MTSTLRVDPSALRSAAGTFSELIKNPTSIELGEVRSALPGLSCADACSAVGTVVDKAAQKVQQQYEKLSTALKSAADTYEKTDAELAAKIKKAGEGTDPDDDKPTCGNPGLDPSTSTGDKPEAIDVDDVTYEKGDWPTGSDATRKAINEALDKRGVTDPAARQRWIDAYMTLTEHESSYNPMAINDWDSNSQPPVSTYNVADGYGNGCSRGLAQCIPTTFAQYHQPGTSNDIYDPVANIAASMNYLEGAYGVNPDGSDILSKIPQANPGVHQGY